MADLAGHDMEKPIQKLVKPLSENIAEMLNHGKSGFSSSWFALSGG
jgi:hypothetical protein